MKTQSVAILGAGAVGSYIIWGLSKKDNIRLGVIAEGDRARRLKESGCAINGAVYRPEVWTPQEAQGVDLLVVALKYGSLPGALESIKTAVGSNTVVMSLMNGVDSEELVAAQVGAEHLLYSFIKVASHKEADGYHFDPDATLGVIYGERFAPFESERVQAVRELFTDSGVNFRVTEHIQEEKPTCNNRRFRQLRSFVVFIVLSQICVLHLLHSLHLLSPLASVIQPFRCAKSVQKCAEPKSAP